MMALHLTDDSGNSPHVRPGHAQCMPDWMHRMQNMSYDSTAIRFLCKVRKHLLRGHQDEALAAEHAHIHEASGAAVQRRRFSSVQGVGWRCC